jgi:hypothetical protein
LRCFHPSSRLVLLRRWLVALNNLAKERSEASVERSGQV